MDRRFLKILPLRRKLGLQVCVENSKFYTDELAGCKRMIKLQECWVLELFLCWLEVTVVVIN